MILRLALRSLSTRPLRTAVLAVGFGLGIGVMAELLGVGEVILEQAHAPALQGGGDLVVTGAVGQVDSARFLLSSVLGSSRFRSRTSAISPSKRTTLFLLAHGQATAIAVRGGVPSREQAIGDPEVAGQPSWTDTPADTAWTDPSHGDVLRAMDRFHPMPVGPAEAGPHVQTREPRASARSAASPASGGGGEFPANVGSGGSPPNVGRAESSTSVRRAKSPANVGSGGSPPNVGRAESSTSVRRAKSPANVGSGGSPPNVGSGESPANVGSGESPANVGSGFSRTSWAEWLYFNGKSADGSLRFYLTFMAGAPEPSRKRPIFVRLQLTRAGQTSNYSVTSTVDEQELLERAPDLDVGANRVRLDGLRYVITLSLASESAPSSAASAVTGEIALDAVRDRSLPPAVIHGAHGWLSGYVVPVLSGTFHGSLRVGGEEVSVEGAAGYHDHNWGFWEGVRWQWGQVAGGDISVVYGRVFPPATVADASRIPGFLGVLGPDGPIAFSSDVSIDEEDRGDRPKAITVRARGPKIDLTLRLEVSEAVATRMALTRSAAGAMNFLQLGGVYQVTGRVGDRDVSFTARGSAETFRY